MLELIEEGFEAVEPLFPEEAEAVEVGRGILERRRVQRARAPLRVAPAHDEPRLLEHLEVLRDRRLAHVERFGEFGDRVDAGAQAIKDRPPGGVGEGAEDGVEGVGGGLAARCCCLHSH